jgi:hypothetical protein
MNRLSITPASESRICILKIPNIMACQNLNQTRKSDLTVMMSSDYFPFQHNERDYGIMSSRTIRVKFRYYIIIIKVSEVQGSLNSIM